jgi:hypothetical protein
MEATKKLDHFIVVGGMSWGKADDLTKAFKNWLKHERPRQDMVVHVRQVNAEAYVDGMGTLYASPDTIKLPDIKVPHALVRKMDDVQEDINELLYKAEAAIDYEKMEGSNG